MGQRDIFEGEADDADEHALLNQSLIPTNEDIDLVIKDNWNLAYSIHFLLGAGYLVPWNAFITAIDYFSYIYPSAHVDRVFTLTCSAVQMAVYLILIAGGAKRISVQVRVNLGWLLLFFSLIGVVMIDVLYVKGQREVYGGFYVTVAAAALCGIAQGIVQGSLIGSTGELLPTRFMQGLVAGTSGSGILVAIMRITSKTIYPKDPHGLRSSAILYFGMSIAVILLCLVGYNLLNSLPIIRYYQGIKHKANIVETSKMNSPPSWLSWKMNKQAWYIGFGVILNFIVTSSIYPGPLVEDLHSIVLKDWYPILLISCFDIFDLVGKCTTAFYVVENVNVAMVGAFGRLGFYPLFLICLHESKFFATEIPVALLTCLLGLTNGYLQSLFFILAPKVVDVENAEVTGVAMVMFLIIGIVVGTALSWVWLI